MAVEKHYMDDDDYEQEKDATKKRTRITIDVTPALRHRIRLAALNEDLSVSEYVGNILEENVPDEEILSKRQGRPITREAIERLLRVREKIIEETGGQIMEDSAEAVRQAREERTRELMGEL